MGIFLFANVRNANIRAISSRASFVLEEIARYANDNTGYTYIGEKKRYNKIGQDSYPSISTIAKNLRSSRTYVTEGIKELKEVDLIKHCGKMERIKAL